MTLWHTRNIYHCDATVVFTGDAQYVMEVSQDHQQSRTNGDVLGVRIQSQRNVRIFPRNIGYFYTNLESLGIKSTSIDSISSDDLMSFGNLKAFDFYNNKLQTVSGDLFVNNPLLQHVSFGKNPLELVTPETFERLKNLQSLYLVDSKCINEGAQDDQQRVFDMLNRVAYFCDPNSNSKIISETFNSSKSKQNLDEMVAEISSEQDPKIIEDNEQKKFNSNEVE